jgi:hypothetical protein
MMRVIGEAAAAAAAGRSRTHRYQMTGWRGLQRRRAFGRRATIFNVWCSVWSTRCRQARSKGANSTAAGGLAARSKGANSTAAGGLGDKTVLKLRPQVPYDALRRKVRGKGGGKAVWSCGKGQSVRGHGMRWMPSAADCGRKGIGDVLSHELNWIMSDVI